MDKWDIQQQWNTEWARRAFPSNDDDSRFEGVINHLVLEIGEAFHTPGDIDEWADCFILLMQAAHLQNHSMSEIFEAVNIKSEINRNRKWGKADEYGVVRHEA